MLGRKALRSSVILVVLALQSCSLFFGDHSEQTVMYVVKSGDTVSSIAQLFDASGLEIIRLNNVIHPDQLEAGQVLSIPIRDGAIPAGLDRRSSESRRLVGLSSAKHYVGQLTWPVKGGRSNSRFGYRGGRFHEGQDIKAPEGTAVHAAHSGVVVYSGRGMSGYGNLVIIRGSGILTVYAHNSRVHVEVGDKVERGEVVAEVGQTGRATGPHLHFETRILTGERKWAAVDPMIFFLQSR